MATWESYIKNYTDSTIPISHDFETCGMYIIKSFITNNYVPNMDCIQWLKDIDWEISTNISKQYASAVFGTTDVWDELMEYNTTSASTDKASGHDHTWYIIGIVFIIAFSISTAILCYMVYLVFKDDTKYTYRATSSADIDATAP